MGNAYAQLDLRSPDRVPVLCVRICDARRRTAPRPGALRPEAEDGRGGPVRALGGGVSVSEYIVETDRVHNISHSSKPGEAMPACAGQYSSLMVLRRRACVPERSRLGGPKEKTQDNADTALIRLFTSNKDGGTCRAVARAARASEKGSSSCSRRDGVLSNLGNHSGRRVAV